MTTYYLNASTGSDSNNGTSASTPWQTLNHAFSNSGNNDILNLQSCVATYTLPSNFTINGQQIIGASTLGCVLDGGNSGVYILLGTSGSTPYFSNLTIQNVNQGSSFSNFINTSTSVNSCGFSNVILKNITAGEGLCSGSATYTFIGCLFWNLSSTYNFYNGVISGTTGIFLGSTYYSNISTSNSLK